MSRNAMMDLMMMNILMSIFSCMGMDGYLDRWLVDQSSSAPSINVHAGVGENISHHHHHHHHSHNHHEHQHHHHQIEAVENGAPENSFRYFSRPHLLCVVLDNTYINYFEKLICNRLILRL